MARDPAPVERDDKTPIKDKPKVPAYPPPEDEFGGGDICSQEQTPSAEDEAPLP